MVSAAGQGLVDVIAERAAMGEDVNQLIGGSSPMTNAAANGHREACELLLQLKADINKMGYNNTTPLQWAADRNQTSTADFLRQRGGR
jgi:ankyrin repeat protein